MMSKSSGRKKGAPSMAPAPEKKPEWAVLFYLAGDLDSPRGEAIRTDLCEILSAGCTDEVFVAVQFDCRDNCYRYVAPANNRGKVKKILRRKTDRVEDAEEGGYQKGTTQFEPNEVLGRINTGDESELENFLLWGLAQPAEHVALVLSGKNRLDNDRLSSNAHRHPMVFTVCRDDSTRAHLGFADFSAAIRNTLAKSPRKELDILALDSTQSQFIELAHELADTVKVLVGPQTPIPMSGWDYTRVLEEWQKQAKLDAAEARDRGKAADPQSDAEAKSGKVRGIAALLVRVITDCYATALKAEARRPAHAAEANPEDCAVSALDLKKLERVSQIFDTICLGLMQSLGEGPIWDTRVELHKFLKGVGQRYYRKSRVFDDYYDCGQFFALFALAMDTKASLATFDWLGWLLSNHGSADWKQTRIFWNSVRDLLAQGPEQEPGGDGRGIDKMDPVWLEDLRARLGKKENLKRTLQQRIDENKRHCEIGREYVDSIRKWTDDLMWSWMKGMEEDDPHAKGGFQPELELVAITDLWLRQAIIERAECALNDERRKSFHHSLRISKIARRLARQARILTNEMRPGQGLVIASACTDPEKRHLWSGVSIYRPDYDDLMNPEYQKFSFHRKIHWAALLGAVQLIEVSPSLAMWRLVSSLLSTGSADTRRDLLDRLSGEGSVVWGMRNQFRVLAPAPMLTLSIEQRGEKPLHPGTHSYLIRLESTRRDAIVYERTSVVQGHVLQRILGDLQNLLNNEAIEAGKKYRHLLSLGGILGDEVLQDMGRTLINEAELIGNRVAQQGDGKNRVHLQLQLPRELMNHPWELMSIGKRLVGEHFAIGRRVFMEPGFTRPVVERQQGRIRPLIVVPRYKVGNLPEAELEGAAVCANFLTLAQNLGEVVDFEVSRDVLSGEDATWLNFCLKLCEGEYDIIHFSGHGQFHEDDPESSAWMFHDEAINARTIRNMLINLTGPPWLVYGNACKSAVEVPRSHSSYHNSVFGMASAFINHGVAAYIAPIWDIEDEIAKDIAIRFYDELLLQRSTLGEALRTSKQAEHKKLSERRPEPDPIGWASVVLYGDPTGELLQALAGKEVDPKTAATRPG
jgi:hypothetical protein